MPRMAKCHPDRRHYAKDMCRSCYNSSLKPKTNRTVRVAGTCPHEDRPRFAWNLCKSCYQIDLRNGVFDNFEGFRGEDLTEEIIDSIDLYGFTIRDMMKEHGLSEQSIKSRLVRAGRKDLWERSDVRWT